MSAAVAAAPCRAVGGRALISLVPAVLDPLIDAAAHVVEPERIRPEAADLCGLLGREITAILEAAHARLELVSPPIFVRPSAPRVIFPFGSARKQISLLRRLSE